MRTLSPKVLRELRNYLSAAGTAGDSEAERLYQKVRAPEPRRSVKAASSRRSERKATKREKTAAIRAFCLLRSQGRCECGCNAQEMKIDPLTLDHFRGGAHRRSNESVEGCWMLLASCHSAKTTNYPSRLDWLARFREHCLRHGYTKEARETERLIDFASTKEAFGVAR